MKPSNTDVSERSQALDPSLVRENLKLSPRQRLEQLESLIEDMNRLRQAVSDHLKNVLLNFRFSTSAIRYPLTC
jgi:hypothetical protein